VLEKNGRHVPALVGMASVTGGPAARAYLKTALDINPYSVPGRVALAGLLMEDEQYDEAADQLNRALQINPESLDALAKLAAMAYLRDDYETFRWFEGKVAALSPGNGFFYARVAEVCGRNYRFAEAVDMAAKAVALDAGNWNGHIVFGMNLLRLGREEQGREQLEIGFRGDPFHVWAMNMLSVLDAMDGFETRTTAHFVVRMGPEDAVVVWPYLKILLEECWQRLTVKYGCQLAGPTLIEVFTKQEDFAVRTSGLPDIGHLLGVCFGSVITLSSPRAHTPPGSINWQEVVWHEFAHAVTLQMANNRIPRWLSEGVSVYEESKGRPEWGRRQDIELVRAVQGNRLISLDQLDAAFSKAKDLADLNFAYYQSSLLVAFIVERYGFNTLKTLIRRYADDISQSAIFEAVFNATEADLQTLFFTWLQARSRKINIFVDGGEPMDLTPSSDRPQGDSRLSSEQQRKMLIENLENRIKAQPRDFLAHLQLGLLLHAAKENKSASRHLTAARDLLPNYSASPNPREILAAIYEERGDLRSMARELEALAKIRQNAFEACFKLGQIAWGHNNYDRAVYYLERALAVNPYAPEVHRLLGTAAFQRKNYPKAVREFEVLLALDQTDPAVANTNLAEAHLRGGDKARAKQYALAALEIAPLFERAQDILLDAIEP
jgi:tetratricopeptide (TPR) repeat protein